MNKQELSDTLDKFIYGKIGDELRRDPTGCHLHVGGCWIPVEDWKKQRRYNLPEIAEYFYDLGKKDMKEQMLRIAHNRYEMSMAFVPDNLEVAWAIQRDRRALIDIIEKL